MNKPMRYALIAPLVAPIGLISGPGRIGAVELDAADTVVLQPAEIEVALVLAHRGQGRMRDAGRIPVGLQHFAGFREFQHAAMVQPRRQPLVGRHLLDHAAGGSRGLRIARSNAGVRMPTSASQ